jgi:DNA-binding NarL/FixJ family response regulator
MSTNVPRVSTFVWNGEELAIVSRVVREGAGLTDAEREIVAAIARGWSNAEIAAARGTSVRTVANQIATLLRKHGAASRYDLVRVLKRLR